MFIPLLACLLLPAAPTAKIVGDTIEVTAPGKVALAAPDRALTVYVDRPGKRADQPAVLGTTRADTGRLVFTPKYSLTPGVRYRVVVRDGPTPTEVVVFIPKEVKKPTTFVKAVYPTADRLPENQLKFYLHFSAPMTQGGSYRHIRLLGEKGKEVDLPFLELDEELWDRDGVRFTLFFDPGRIKRGLKPREEHGPALEEGKTYTLVIDRGWADADGTPMKETFRKTFKVGPPDDTPPDVKTWKLTPPKAGRGALRVTFPKSMEHALLHRLVWVADGEGKRVDGTIAVSERETVWTFTPKGAWRAGAYRLVADTRLEDLSGNSIGRPFEVDVLRKVERTITTRTVEVPFRVGR